MLAKNKTQEIAVLLSDWLAKRIAPESFAWLNQQIAKIRQNSAPRTLFIAFSSISRQLEKQDLNLSPDKIFATADLQEAIALYQSLPLLPYPEKFKLRAAEGVRTNMTAVFQAVALHNPYPAQYLDDLAWNQMILKAFFVGTPLDSVYGLKSRNNPQLAQMLLDYARERLAAQRSVSPQLWDLVAPFNSQAIADSDSWFTYYYWLDDSHAPDFARTVDIHRKPGFDPVELFVDPQLQLPKLKIAATLLKKKLGCRYLMEVIPLDANLVKGSHGHITTSLERSPLLITQAKNLLNSEKIAATDVFQLILAHLLST